MCGSFTCSKNSLIALNIFYVLVAVILIGVAGAAKVSAVVTSLSVVSGIVACGIFLLIISFWGLVAASKHNQVMLFIYMIVLFIIFVIQFAVACACLAINENQQGVVADEGWKLASPKMQEEAQILYGCCGYDSLDVSGNGTMKHPSCLKVTNSNGEPCCHNATEDTCCTSDDDCQCRLCRPMLVHAIGGAFNTVGGVGLFFSFTEIIGMFIAHTYRHQMDPRANVQSLLQKN